LSKVTIYTTSNCPYCVSAKSLFKKLGIAYEEVSLEGKNELRMKLSEDNNGWRTVPMIFINEKFMGGFSDINDLHQKGQLTPLLGEK
jgi:glutaredoxin 3